VTRARVWLAESFKFALTVAVFLFLNWLAPNFEGPAADAAQQVAVALIAGFLTFLTLDVVFGRPVIRAAWSQGGHPIPDRRPHLELRPGERRVIRVELFVDCATLLARWVSWLSRRHPIECRLTLMPPEALRCTPQTMPSDAQLNRNVVTVHLTGGLRPGINNAVEVSVTPRQPSAASSQVDCHMELSTPTRMRFFLWALVGRDNGIDGFIIGGVVDGRIHEWTDRGQADQA